MPNTNILNDYSQTIGREIQLATESFGSEPAKWRGWAWNSKNPEFLYVTTQNSEGTLTRKFHFFLFAGKIEAVKQVSDKTYYKLTDASIAALKAPPAPAQGSQAPSASPAPTGTANGVPIDVKKLSK